MARQTPDDEATADLLAMVEAHASRNWDLLAHTIATMDVDELRGAVNRLCALVDLRARVGLDQPTTAEWARWLRSQEGIVL